MQTKYCSGLRGSLVPTVQGRSERGQYFLHVIPAFSLKKGKTAKEKAKANFFTNKIILGKILKMSERRASKSKHFNCKNY